MSQSRSRSASRSASQSASQSPSIRLSADELLAVLRAEVQLVVKELKLVFLADPVPTCPQWTVRDLIEHLGGAHRWAAAVVAGARTENLPDEEQATLMAPPVDPNELVPWFADGAGTLLAAMDAAPVDLQAFTFLRSAPPARLFWARRQAHETTIHRVDLLAAQLGRIPSTAEAGVGPAVAVDGIDELLIGFIQRRSSRLRNSEPFRVIIAPSDVEVAWTVAVSDDPPIVTPGTDRKANSVLSGTAAALYLGLWNRGDDIAETGSVDALGQWRERVRISWS